MDKQYDENWVRKTVIFLVCQTVSLFGSSVVGFGIIWFVTLETSSGSVMMWLTLCSFLPQIVVSLFAGVWADRYSRKLLVIFSDLFIALSTLVLALLFLAGHQSMGLIYVISIIRSIGSGIQMPAVSAILPQIVPAGNLMKVNGINSTLNSVMFLASPAVGGLILSIWGIEATLLLDVVTATVAIVIMCFLAIPKHKKSADAESNSALADLKNGLSYAKNNALIKSLLIFYSLFFFLITPAAFLTPILVERSFGAEVWRLTANEMTWSIGAILGGLLVATWGGFKSKVHTMAFSCIGFGFCFTFLGFADNFWLYLLIMLGAGIFMPIFSAAETVLIQENVAVDMMGRIFSIIQIIVSTTMPLGMLLFGPLADIVRIETILVCTGIILTGLGWYLLKSGLGNH